MSNEVNISIDRTAWNFLLNQIDRKAKGTEPLLRAAFGTFGFRDVIQHFTEEQGDDGPWPKRSAWTQQYYANVMSGKWRPPKAVPRAAFNPSNKLLVLQGHLRKSIIPANLRRVDKNAVMLVSNVGYSGKHDRGEGVPRRAFMWLSDGAQRDIGEMVINMWVTGR